MRQTIKISGASSRCPAEAVIVFESIPPEYKDGIFELNISEDNFNIGFDYLDEESYESLNEEEKQRLDDMFYEGDPLSVSEKEIFNKFIDYVNTNKEIL